MATKVEIIAMLKEDMRDEHGALILYLRHAYLIGESGEACAIEGTARDEMRHYKWLAQGVVQLGGVPTIERTPMDVGGEGPEQWMAQDVRAEEDAIAKYERHLAANDDPRISAMIERILTDEHAHQEVFAGLCADFAAATGPLPTVPADGAAVPAHISRVLDYGTGHEYSVILQYLLHSFMTSDYEVSRELETVAINEMQHMGWLSEYSAEIGHAPLLEPDEVDRSPRTEGMLSSDVDAEEAVFATYGAQIEELSGQPEYAELVDILERTRENEGWHIRMFGLMLSQMRSARPPQQRPGVGRTQPRVEGQPLEAAGVPAGPHGSASESTEPAGPAKPQLTVGSLIECDVIARRS